MDNETALRAHLRISLEATTRPADLPLRQGRRIMWFEDALAPLRRELGPQMFRRLTLGLAACVSLEVLVWLVDLAGLSREDAVEQILWTAEQLIQAATPITLNPTSRAHDDGLVLRELSIPSDGSDRTNSTRVLAE